MSLVPRINGALRRVPVWPVHAVAAGWAAWLFWLGATGGLGVEPVEALEHAYGELALQLLIASLAVTPLRRWTGVSLLRFRRALGLSCFLFAAAHLTVWAVLDVQNVGRVWADIVKRPYVTIGMGAFLLLVPLAVTSNDASLRRMGAGAWRRLHRLAYPAAGLAALHYVWLAKGFQIEPLAYGAVVLGLLASRLPGRRRLAAG